MNFYGKTGPKTLLGFRCGFCDNDTVVVVEVFFDFDFCKDVGLLEHFFDGGALGEADFQHQGGIRLEEEVYLLANPPVNIEAVGSCEQGELRLVILYVFIERVELSSAYVRRIADNQIKFFHVRMRDEGVKQIAVQ